MGEIDINDYVTWEGCYTEKCWQLNAPVPRCNHTKGVSEYNEGYMQGYLDSETPFEAEVFTNDEGEVWLSVVLPCQEEFTDNPVLTEIEHKEEEWDKSVLTLGMQQVDVEFEDYAFDYVDLLLEKELVYMYSEARGHMSIADTEYYLDDEKNLLARVCVALRYEEEDLCYTDLDLWEFPGK